MLKTMAPWLFGLLAAALFALALLGASSFQECVSGHGKQAAEYKQDSGSSLLSLVSRFLAETHLTCVGRFFHNAHEEILAAFTVLLAFFTLALWKSTSDIATDAKESAGKTIKTMEDTAQRQLRAYVSVDTCTVKDVDGNEMTDKVGINIRNAGQTPAHDVFSWIGVGFHEYPLQQPLGSPTEEHGKVLSVLHPGDQKMQITAWPTDTIDSDAAKAGTIAIYLWGEVTYKDVFGAQRYTRFRFFQNLKAASVYRWATYPVGNEAT